MTAHRGRLAARLALGLWLALSAPAGAQAQPAESGSADPRGEASATTRLAAAPRLPLPGPMAGLERDWLGPADSVSERVTRTRRAALQLGYWNLDAAAHAALRGGLKAEPLERARAAVRLAPDLPAARMALAHALWLHGDAPFGASVQAFEALAALVRHPEASVWFLGGLLAIFAVALSAGGLLCVAAAGISAAPHAAHDLGDRVARAMPPYARAALLGSLLLVPLALGEGALGLGLGLLGVGVVYASARHRVILGLAALALVAGAFPLARVAGSTLGLFAADPVAGAAFASAYGIAGPADLARLRGADAHDILAARTLALEARRSGRLGEADARYQALLADHPDDPVIHNNAANVRLQLNHMESALTLYRRAAELRESPLLLFNLAQAHGRAFQVEELNDALARAQASGGGAVAELTQLQGSDQEGFVAQLLPPRDLLWRRILASPHGDPLASQLRAWMAPGRLGRDARSAGLGLAVVFALAAALGTRFRPSHGCTRCGRRMCPRCHPHAGSGETCDACIRLFHRPEATDRALRVERINALRERELRVERLARGAAVLLPGAAGLLAKRPLRSLIGATLFATAVIALIWREGVVPDPLVAGAAAPLAFLLLAASATAGHAVIAALTLRARRKVLQ